MQLCSVNDEVWNRVLRLKYWMTMGSAMKRILGGCGWWSRIEAECEWWNRCFEISPGYICPLFLRSYGISCCGGQSLWCLLNHENALCAPSGLHGNNLAELSQLRYETRGWNIQLDFGVLEPVMNVVSPGFMNEIRPIDQEGLLDAGVVTLDVTLLGEIRSHLTAGSIGIRTNIIPAWVSMGNGHWSQKPCWGISGVKAPKRWVDFLLS